MDSLQDTVNRQVSPWQQHIPDTDLYQDVKMSRFVCIDVASLCRQNETGSKLDGRGDSAVSKGTTDSGVVMESAQISALPGQVPGQLPPLTCVGESELVGPKP